MLRLDDILDAASEVVRPAEMLDPSVWAERYRDVESGPFRGRWDNANGPHLVGIMDAVREAIETDRHLVIMKGAQEGVTEAVGVNAVAWLLASLGGPILYLTSKKEVAEELVKDRWTYVLETCEPLKRKHVGGTGAAVKGKAGDKVLVKRFTDGKLQLTGSRSSLNFLSSPYAVVIFDELDACRRELDGEDPIEKVLRRLDAYAEGRQVLLVAFAHPTTKDFGAAELYYNKSDQRRAHVECPKCSRWIAPLWEHVKVIPREGQPAEQAELDPTRYRLACHLCGELLSDADRLKMIRRVEQRSTLPPEVAKSKKWIGLHVWHLFLRKGGRVRELARQFIDARDDPSKMIVFVNKVCGDHYASETRATTAEEWRACVSSPRFDGDPRAYYTGEVPPDVVFLTSGQDTRASELHWCVWGWGLVEGADGIKRFCGWLVDYGVVPVEKRATPAGTEKTVDASDLEPIAQLLYEREFPRVDVEETLPVRAGYHDSGWCPVAVYGFCHRHDRATPARGDNVDEASASKRPVHRWGASPVFTLEGEEIANPNMRIATLNTFALKREMFGLVSRRFVRAVDGDPQTIITLPRDVSDEWIAHACSERLVQSAGAKPKRVWKAVGPNHWSDCNVQAFAAALQINPFQRGKTRDEHLAEARAQAEAQARRRLDGPAPRRPAVSPVRRPPGRPGVRRSY